MALDAYMKVEGVTGESTDDKYKDWIEITGYSFGNTHSTSATASSAGGATSGRTSLTNFHITKELDTSSVKLLGMSCAGDHIKQVTIAVHRSGGDKVKYFEIVMEEVLISSYSQIAQEGVPHESIQLNFGRIRTTYVKQMRNTGAGGGSVIDGWDRIANKRHA